MGGGGMRAEDEDCEQATEGFVTVVTGGPAVRPEARAGARRIRAARAVAGATRAAGGGRACSICVAASSRRSIFAADSACRRVTTAVRRSLSASRSAGELYGLIVDRVGDVLRLKRSSYEANPVNLDQRWTKVCAGVHRLDHGLMVVLDVDKVLDLSRTRRCLMVVA